MKRKMATKRIKREDNVSNKAKPKPCATSINSLPFDCLSLIFKRTTTLTNRITRLSLVCQFWKSTVDQMCVTQGTLYVNVFNDYQRNYWDLVKIDLEKYYSNVKRQRMQSLTILVPNYSFEHVPDLSVRFPAINRLIIRSNDCTEPQNSASLSAFTHLLRMRWSRALSSLTISKISPIHDPEFLSQLCRTIDFQFGPSKQLRALSLEIQSFGTDYQSHPGSVKLFRILPHLERFYISCTFRNFYQVFNIFGGSQSQQQLPNQQQNQQQISNKTKIKIKELDLSDFDFPINRLIPLLATTTLTCTVTHLHLTVAFEQSWFSFVCAHFGQLQFLRLNVSYLKLDSGWIEDISKLNRLTELRLYNFTLDPTVPERYTLPTVRKLTICDRNVLTKFQRKQLSNERKVSCICPECQFNADLYCRVLSHQFPSVSRLVLFSNEQLKCGWVKQAEDDIRECAQRYLKQLTKLVLVLQAEEFNK